MDKPEAIRLADLLEKHLPDLVEKAAAELAAELRRLHHANQELVEALETLPAGSSYKTHNAASALRQALEQPDYGIDRGAWDDVPDATKWVDELRGGDETEQEPVAWMYVNEDGECEQIEYGVSTVQAPYIKLLYTAPPSKPWVSLTVDEIWGWFESNTAITQDGAFRIARAIEAKLKEKNI